MFLGSANKDIHLIKDLNVGFSFYVHLLNKHLNFKTIWANCYSDIWKVNKNDLRLDQNKLPIHTNRLTDKDICFKLKYYFFTNMLLISQIVPIIKKHIIEENSPTMIHSTVICPEILDTCVFCVSDIFLPVQL